MPSIEDFRREARGCLAANVPAGPPPTAEIQRNVIAERALGLPKGQR